MPHAAFGIGAQARARAPVDLGDAIASVFRERAYRLGWYRRTRNRLGIHRRCGDHRGHRADTAVRRTQGGSQHVSTASSVDGGVSSARGAHRRRGETGSRTRTDPRDRPGCVRPCCGADGNAGDRGGQLLRKGLRHLCDYLHGNEIVRMTTSLEEASDQLHSFSTRYFDPGPFD